MPAVRSALAWTVAVLTVVAAGCSDPDQTSLLIEVTSPLQVPEDIDQLDFLIIGGASGARIERRFDITRDWPHSLSVRPGETEMGAVTIHVTGRKRPEGAADGAFVVRRVVRSAFVAGEEVRVEIVLPADCRGLMCPGDQDCIAGQCVREPDGGPGDGGVDGGPPPDCEGDAECDDTVACTIDSCQDGVCIHTPDNSRCQVGETCDPIVGCPPRTCMSDDHCDDRNACNGEERCVDETCQPGTPIDCDDLDACTDDGCSPDRGMCVATTRDADGDMFGDMECPEAGGVAATDCNDMSPTVFPGAPEDCNGADDDCNGTCDDGFTCCRGQTGDCTTTCDTTGSRICGATCGWGVCSPPPESCNGEDDDCNGAPDDVFACVRGRSEMCTTACGSMGTRTCGDDCMWSACTAGAESCNGLDDDCNGMPDDGFACVRGTSVSCMTSCMSMGSRLCDATCMLTAGCTPPPEGCNGDDDDCDGRIDETVECTAGMMGGCTTTCGSTGSRTCGPTCTWGMCTPPAEICNGDDDDCDGRIDETFTCVPGAVGSCPTGCMTTGSRTCTASCTWGTCTPPIEACDGRDNDCDMMCDETFACCALTGGSCLTTCGTMGSRTCSGSCAWSVCSPPAEICNGTDDDCNGTCDDGFACCRGMSVGCPTTCGSTGSRACSATCTLGGCVAPPETCTGADDDCDGAVDEGFMCVRGASEMCPTSCGTMGTRTCSASCAWSACMPPAETCNGVDDDCDGMIDEGCGGCGSCPGTTTVVAPGGRFTHTLGPHALTGSCGGAGGSEAYFTFTLAAAADVFISTHGAGIDTVLYVRRCACAGTEVGCNDDADGQTTSVLRLPALAADTYNVIVDTKSAMSAPVQVDIYISPPGGASDRCGNPTLIPAGAANITGTTCGFTDEYVPIIDTDPMNCPFSGAGVTAPERVYYFVVPTMRTVTVDGCTPMTSYDSVIYMRSVCSDASMAAQRMCNDDGCSGLPDCGAGYRSSRSVSLAPGLYYLMVDGYGSGSTCPCGTYQFNLTGF